MEFSMCRVTKKRAKICAELRMRKRFNERRERSRLAEQ